MANSVSQVLWSLVGFKGPVYIHRYWKLNVKLLLRLCERRSRLYNSTRWNPRIGGYWEKKNKQKNNSPVLHYLTDDFAASETSFLASDFLLKIDHGVSRYTTVWVCNVGELSYWTCKWRTTQQFTSYTKVEYKKLKRRHIECNYSQKYTASYKEPPHVGMNIVVWPKGLSLAVFHVWLLLLLVFILIKSP